MKTIAWAVAFGVAIGLLAAGVIFLVSRPARGQPVELLPPPTPKPIMVQVSGAVQRPGVYELPAGSRVLDAVQAAAGFSEDANQALINLAAYIQDGDKVFVPALKLPEGETADSNRSSTIQVSDLVNINTATQAELETLPEIGPAIAQAIIAYREQNGSFSSIEAIQNVPGIGPAIFAQIEPLITIESTP